MSFIDHTPHDARTAYNLVWDTGTLQWVVMTQPGGGGGGGGAVTVADGADVAQGNTADAAWSGSGAGTVIAILKKIASAGGSAVSIADGSNVVEGALADAAIITDTTGTMNGKLRGLVKWAFERMPASLGQKAMTASLPVVLASDQAAIPVTLASTTITGSVAVTGPLTDVQLRASAVPVSAASLPLPTGASTEATLALIKAKTDNLDVLLSTRTKPADSQHVTVDNASLAITAAALPLPTGASTAANQATEIASLASIDGKTPTLGQKTMAGSVPVTIASDQGAIPITGSISANSSADVKMDEVTGNYATNATGKNLTQTNTGRLRVNDQPDDEFGNLQEITNDSDLRRQMMLELRALRIGFQQFLDAGDPGKGTTGPDNDLLELAKAAADADYETF